MNFFVKDINGEEHGPVNEKELEQLVDSDLVTRDEAVKRALMRNWSPAGEFDFLKAAFIRADKRKAERENVDYIEQVNAPGSSAVSHFENEYVPVGGGAKLRFWSFVNDLGIVCLVLLFLLLAGTGAAFIKAFNATVTDGEVVDAVVSERKEIDDKIVELRRELAELKGEPLPEDEKTLDESGSETESGSLARIRKGASEREKLAETVMPAAPSNPSASSSAPVADAASERRKERRIKVLEASLAELTLKPEPRETNKSASLPTVVDDSRAGYSVGSVWSVETPDSSSSVSYVCIRAGENRALWCEKSFLSLLATVVFSLLAVFVIIYPAVQLGLYARTRGMNFYGIFLSDIEKPTRVEVLSFRAFIFYIVSLVTLPLIPFFMTAGARTPGELVTRTRVIRISAKK